MKKITSSKKEMRSSSFLPYMEDKPHPAKQDIFTHSPARIGEPLASEDQSPSSQRSEGDTFLSEPPTSRQYSLGLEGLPASNSYNWKRRLYEVVDKRLRLNILFVYNKL